MRSRARFLDILLGLALAACGSAGDSATATPPDAEAPAVDVLAPFCGAGSAPRTGAVSEGSALVALLATLPKPVSLPCLLAALPRPIDVVGSKNVVSAQPAAGPDNPRVFVRAGDEGLVLSITLAGETSTHLETAEPVEPGYSIKGDLAFPRADPPAERELYDGIVTAKETGTVCGGCHAGEHEVRRVDGMPAFASRMLKPRSGQRVSLDALRSLANACDPADAEPRCLMLRALFRSPDDLRELQWPQDTATF